MTTIETIQSKSISNTENTEAKNDTEITSGSVPLYDKPIVKFDFKTESEYQDWLESTANKQGIWNLKSNYLKVNSEREELLAEGRFLKNSQRYCCDHYGKPRKSRKSKLIENNEGKKIRKRGPSKKVLCRAQFCKKLFTNGEVEVTYHWQHVNHDALSDVAIKNAKKDKINKQQQESNTIQREPAASESEEPRENVEKKQ